MEKSEILKGIPKVDRILSHPDLAEFCSRGFRELVVESARAVLGEMRQAVIEDRLSIIPEEDEIVEEIKDRVIACTSHSLREVINATGIVLHTNLGRAPLADRAIENIARIAGGYSNLEYDMEQGARGERYVHVEELLCRLCGTEAALVVNNNAAAVLLALRCLAEGGEVVVSRGELVEIGGSFRIPEIMAQSGCRLVEVGTTNRTHLADYERAINENTSLVLKVHPSNYRIVGFAKRPTTAELASLAHAHGLALMEDLGSGCLVDLSKYGLYGEPTARDVVNAGADIVTFSGDKLLGGPQAGLIVGRSEYIEQMKRHPLLRAVRIDKLTLAALEATLRLYLSGDYERLPVFRMMVQDAKSLLNTANRIKRKLIRAFGDRAEVLVIRTSSRVGGGSFPQAEVPSFAVAIMPFAMSVDELARRLRLGEPPVIARIEADALVLDPRTLLPKQEKVLIEAVIKAMEGG
ncbi:MAG TPA: L-seryl-tRNA(Sec) selenium transferase [Proteobacteria bacterium]|nr:L-seryl-tRNA(Sec) selenium transferase [Pseudomonadota bacterium]